MTSSSSTRLLSFDNKIFGYIYICVYIYIYIYIYNFFACVYIYFFSSLIILIHIPPPKAKRLTNILKQIEINGKGIFSVITTITQS